MNKLLIQSQIIQRTNNCNISVGALTMYSLLRRRAKLYNQDQSASIFAWPRDYVKEHTPTEITVRKQADFTVDSSGQISISKESDESFEPVNNDNYQFSLSNNLHQEVEQLQVVNYYYQQTQHILITQVVIYQYQEHQVRL